MPSNRPLLDAERMLAESCAVLRKQHKTYCESGYVHKLKDTRDASNDDVHLKCFHGTSASNLTQNAISEDRQL